MDQIPKSEPAKPIEKISQWCVEHPILSILAGLLCILAGLYINELYSVHTTEAGLKWLTNVHWSAVFYHFLVILGEAIVVMFFLHVFIEKVNSHAHHEQSREAIRHMESLSAAILTDKKNEIEKVFGDLIQTFTTEGRQTVEALKVNLFAAILEDKMPAEVVKVILENDFFNTHILRRNLKVEYVLKEIKEKSLIIEQRISFDMQYISGKEEFIEYLMPFSLSDTPLASYTFIEASFKTLSASNDSEYVKLNQTDNFQVREYGKNREKDSFELSKPIMIAKNETITVEQVMHAEYLLDDKGMFDSYHVNNHTVDVTVVFDLPPEFDVALYPTFPEKFLPPVRTLHNRRSYDRIKFLVPGQGFGFSIKKQ
ncbi:hypothetical protein [Mucilaginibacter sp. PAMB04168]|uniref:hypothetical protein n=1 Tax=Mucilaginibacter sp. PAMB04168 TaxID=3138567 RepID=UPI0031F62893